MARAGLAGEDGGGRSQPRRRRNQPGQREPVAAHRRAGLVARGDRVFDGRDDQHRQAERRQRRPGEQARRRRARPGGEGRRGGFQGRDRHGRHQRRLEEDRGHHRRDRRDRVPDQSAGAERRGGSGARRRAGPRIRGGRDRGAQPRRSLGDGRQGDQGADPGHRAARWTRARTW